MTRIARLIAVSSLSLVATLAVSTSAHAAPLWELGTPWHVLPVGQVETLKSEGLLRLFEVGKPNGAHCKITDTEVIATGTRPDGSLAAADTMEAFTGKCFLAFRIFPCTAEQFTIRGGKWPSLLTGAIEDEFIGAELEVKCPNGMKEFYLGMIHPVLTVNKLTFNGLASGTFKAGIHELYFEGVDRLKPNLWKKVR